MYNLDAILDEVREKYYASNILPRPSISWSDEYWTYKYGEYTITNNHITISRLLNSDKVTYEQISAVVYHESLHQDYEVHDRKFHLKENLFPNRKEIKKQLQCYYATVGHSFKNNTINNNFFSGYNKVTYVCLPYLEDYINAFDFYDGNILVDLNSDGLYDGDNQAVVFLVLNNRKYHIVSWALKANIFKKPQKILHQKFGGLDINYSISIPRNCFKLLDNQTCCYFRDINTFSDAILSKKYCVEDSNNKYVQKDISYMNTYCEGFVDFGIDPNASEITCDFINVSYSQLRNIALKEEGFHGIIASNSLYKLKPCYESLFIKADALRYNRLITVAYNLMKNAYKNCNGNQECIRELIKLCAMVEDFDLGKRLISELKEFDNQEECLISSIDFLELTQ